MNALKFPRKFRIISNNARLSDIDGYSVSVDDNFYLKIEANEKIEYRHSCFLNQGAWYNSISNGILSQIFATPVELLRSGKVSSKDAIRNIISTYDVIKEKVIVSRETEYDTQYADTNMYAECSLVCMSFTTELGDDVTVAVPIKYFEEVSNTYEDEDYVPESFITSDMEAHKNEFMTSYMNRAAAFADLTPQMQALSIKNSILNFLGDAPQNYGGDDNFKILTKIRRIYTGPHAQLHLIEVVPAHEDLKSKEFTVTLYCGRPGLIIGRGGSLSDAFKKYIQDMVRFELSDDEYEIDINLVEFDKFKLIQGTLSNELKMLF